VKDHNPSRISVITDSRTRENDLPDVAPGAEFECVIASQKFIVLHRIRVVNMALVRLEIGRVKDIPFELESADGPIRTYRLKNLGDDDLKRHLISVGAAVATKDSIAIAPTLEVRVFLRNEGATPAKPRAALLVQEEIS
jgi:hypothetical protein